MSARVTIYVQLLEEGVDCWRPVEADREGAAYTIAGPRPDDEIWQFETGSVVVCEERTFADGTKGLVASGLATARH